MTVAPTLSVLMLTYRHERFVEQALRSVYAQEIDVPVEVVLADDASPDGTLAVIASLGAPPPGIELRVLTTEANLGMHANFRRAWAACRGEAVAILEGDDFWTDPRKLQLQWEALVAQPAATLCFTRAHGVEADGGPREETWPQSDQVGLASADLLQRNFIQTCSVMFRAGVVAGIPAWFDGLPAADWPVAILHAMRGEIAFVDRDTAAYRFHGGGVWSGRDYPARALSSERALRAVVRHGRPSPADRARLDRGRRHLVRSAFTEAVRLRQPGPALGALRAAAPLLRRGSLP